MTNLVNIKSDTNLSRVMCSEADNFLGERLTKPFIDAFVKHTERGNLKQICLGTPVARKDSVVKFAPYNESSQLSVTMLLLTMFKNRFSNGLFPDPEPEPLLTINIFKNEDFTDINTNPNEEQQPDLSVFFSNLEECENLPVCFVLDDYIKSLYKIGFSIDYRHYEHGVNLSLGFVKENYAISIKLDVDHWLTCTSTYGPVGVEDFQM